MFKRGARNVGSDPGADTRLDEAKEVIRFAGAGRAPVNRYHGGSLGDYLRGAIRVEDSMDTALQPFFSDRKISEIYRLTTGIESWEDFEREFLLGAGNSPHTTRGYLASCKLFFDFSGGLHPGRCDVATPERIEAFYDSLIAAGCDIDTCAWRMCGVKYMYKRMCEKLPFVENPFTTMPPKLKTKIGRKKKDESVRDSLTVKEYQAILSMLRKDTSIKGKQNYALVRFAVVSGFRNAELCRLTWSGISEIDGKYSVTIRGKNDKVATVSVEDLETIRICKRAFRARFGRSPEADDRVFHGLPTGRVGKGDGLTTAAIRYRISKIVEQAKAAGIVRQNLIITPHVFRHTCATLLLAEGVDIYSVQKHLRHSDIKTTLRYLHNDADKTEALKAINGEAAA